MPLLQLAALPSSAAMLHRIAAVDDRGRIAEHSLICALGSRPGQPLRIEPLSTTALAMTADTDGRCHLHDAATSPCPPVFAAGARSTQAIASCWPSRSLNCC